MALKTIATFLLFFAFSANNPFKDPQQFIYPLKLNPSLSANFGELRADHFHSGVDMKTNGSTGAEVLAAATGYVYRISITPGGFGKTLYLRHENGYSTVYAHLDRFIPEIEAYVEDYQYSRKSFTVHIYPESDKFRFKQGERIAWSGNSGSSEGPHLHFEVRKSDSEKPVNPLLFNIGVEDNISPVIDQLIIYPVSADALINGSHRPLKLPVSGSHSNFYVKSDGPITLSGEIGFGIRCYDIINNSGNRCGIYRLEMDHDSSNVFAMEINSFSFGETRYINAHIDYRERVNSGVYIHKLWTAPNDKLSLYRNVVNRGIIEFNGNEDHSLRFTASDSHGNTSVLPLVVRSEGRSANSPAPPSGEIRLNYDRLNRFRNDGIFLSIPADALYDSVSFYYRRDPRPPKLLAPVHVVGDETIPLHTAVSLAIKPELIPPGTEKKLFVVKVEKNNRLTYISSKLNNEGFVTCETRSFGAYSVAVDTINPSVADVTLSSKGMDLSQRKSITYKIRDNQSGVKDYVVMIDDKWALFDYDPKTESVTGTLDPARVTRNSNHKIVIKVTDMAGNETYSRNEFRW